MWSAQNAIHTFSNGMRDSCIREASTDCFQGALYLTVLLLRLWKTNKQGALYLAVLLLRLWKTNKQGALWLKVVVEQLPELSVDLFFGADCDCGVSCMKPTMQATRACARRFPFWYTVRWSVFNLSVCTFACACQGYLVVVITQAYWELDLHVSVIHRKCTFDDFFMHLGISE